VCVDYTNFYHLRCSVYVTLVLRTFEIIGFTEMLLGAGIAQWYNAGLRAGWWEVRVPVGAGNFSPPRPDQPPVQQVSGPLFLGVKRPGREADHSPPPSAEVKNAWSYTSTSLYAFMALC
jgi:hypothetical protein